MTRGLPGSTLPDPNADYGRLWAAVHDYLVTSGADQPNANDIARAYAELVESHNLIHDRYVADPEPVKVAGT